MFPICRFAQLLREIGALSSDEPGPSPAAGTYPDVVQRGPWSVPPSGAMNLRRFNPLAKQPEVGNLLQQRKAQSMLEPRLYFPEQ
jgi:hypothetical protein